MAQGAVHIPGHASGLPLDGVGMKVGRSVEAEVNPGFVTADALGEVIDLQASRIAPQDFDVYLIIWVVVVWPRVGEESRHRAGEVRCPQASLEATIAEKLVAAILAGGIGPAAAASRTGIIVQANRHLTVGEPDVIGKPMVPERRIGIAPIGLVPAIGVEGIQIIEECGRRRM